jgi:hypothetical protein
MSAIASDTDPHGWSGATKRGAKRLPLGSKSFVAVLERCEMREGAQAFLRDHPELGPFLRETAANVRDSFGQQTALALETFQEPEAARAPVELFLLVKTSLDVPEARERMDRFGDEWWLDNMNRCDGLLHVALEFV